MTRRRSALVLVLALVAAGCGSQQPAFEDPLANADKRFIAQVVDSLGDVGRNASIAVDADDVAHVAYLGFAEPVAGDQPPATRPIGSPAVPAVLSAAVAPDDIDRGAIFQDAKVNQESTTGIAVDGAGVQHVVWTIRPAGVVYSSSEDGVTWTEPARVADGIAHGVSIAVGGSGAPWVAWIEQGAVRAATGSGTFAPEDVATVGTRTGLDSRTVVAIGPDGQPVVAFNDPARNTAVVATRSSGGDWTLTDVQAGGGGYGVSLALDAEGVPYVAYYTEPAPDRGEVRLATPGGGDAWDVVSVGRFQLPDPRIELPFLSTGVAVDADGVRYVAWFAGAGRGIAFATDQEQPGTFERVDTTAGLAGASPRVAAGPEGTVHLSWYDLEELDLQTAVYGDVELVLAHPVEPSAPPTTQPTSQPSGGTDCPKGGLPLTAPAGAAVNGFDTSTLDASAGPVAICFTNADAPVPHNVHVFDGPDANAGDLGLTEVSPPGPDFQVADLGDLAAGDYHYQCDIHPTTMTGTLTVA